MQYGGPKQMRSQIEKFRHAGEIMIDLLKAFEYVSRQGLARRGGRGDYPTHVVAASLATYAFRRRLVYKGFVSKELWPLRRINCRLPFLDRRFVAGMQWFYSPNL